MRKFIAYLTMLRPHQWLKNGFVLAPGFFSGQLFLGETWLDALMAFIMFCAVASSVYIINDAIDAPKDRLHPKKRHRPLAAGIVKGYEAALLLILLCCVAAALGWIASLPLLGWLYLVTYIFLNILYSLWIKHVPVVEWFILSSGFLLRLLFGAIVIAVDLSPWIMLCTGLLAMLLFVGKRRADMVQNKGNATTQRPVLADYSIFFLDAVTLILAAATFTFYTLFCVSDYAIARFGENVILSVPILLFGLLEYLRLLLVKEKGDDPTLLVITAPGLQVCLVCFGLLFGGLLYG